MFHCVYVGAIDADVGLYAFRGGVGGWGGGTCYNTSVFFRLMVRPKFFVASENGLTMCCRASSLWARRAQSSANSSSVMSFWVVFVRARRRRRLKRLQSVRKRV